MNDRESDSQREEQSALTAQLYGAAATKRTHDISQTFDLYQKMQRIPPFTRGCRTLAETPVPLQGGCRNPQCCPESVLV